MSRIQHLYHGDVLFLSSSLICVFHYNAPNTFMASVLFFLLRLACMLYISTQPSELLFQKRELFCHEQWLNISSQTCSPEILLFGQRGKCSFVPAVYMVVSNRSSSLDTPVVNAFKGEAQNPWRPLGLNKCFSPPPYCNSLHYYVRVHS